LFFARLSRMSDTRRMSSRGDIRAKNKI
jgi:hypothetical protein